MDDGHRLYVSKTLIHDAMPSTEQESLRSYKFQPVGSCPAFKNPKASCNNPLDNIHLIVDLSPSMYLAILSWSLPFLIAGRHGMISPEIL